MCFGRLKRTHAVVEAAVATMVPRTQAILRALLRRCFRGSRAAIAAVTLAAALLQRCCRAARRPNRWSSRSVRMLRWRYAVLAHLYARCREWLQVFLAAETRVDGFSLDVYCMGIRASLMSKESLYCCHYTLSDGGGDGGVSRARSAARDICRSPSSVFVNGCAPPRTRRAILSVFSPVVTASRRSSSVAASSW